MQNLLLITNNTDKIEEFLNEYARRQKVPPANIYRFGFAQSLTVEEFRQILKLSQSRYSRPTIFMLYNFDHNSAIIQNTFLKNLEEHQKNLLFVLSATNRGNILPTIISRCTIKSFPAKINKLSAEKQSEFTKTINEIKQTNLATAVIRLGFKDKKTNILNWLDQFLSYGYQTLPQNSHNLWLSRSLKQAIINRNLIEVNNLDPEIGLDHVFLIWLLAYYFLYFF